MSSEFYEAYKALKLGRDAKERRSVSKEQFDTAKGLAEKAGLFLVQRSDIQYTLGAPSGWLLNIYPGNKRLYHDRNYPKPPFFQLNSDWDLLDVVKSAIQGEKCGT